MSDEEIEPEASAEDAGDPAVAFDALRHTVEQQGDRIGAEMTIIRRGLEAAFDQFEKFQQPADYGPDLGRVVQQLAQVGKRLEVLEQSPILRNGPEHYARALERGGESLVRTAAQQFENESRDFQRTARELADHIAGARERHVQNRLLWIAGGVGLVAGVILILLLPRILPFAADTHVASLVMGQARWSAGITMMREADPGTWRGVVDAWQLVDDNAEAVGQCVEAARTAGADQRCTIIVKAPAAPAQ